MVRRRPDKRCDCSFSTSTCLRKTSSKRSSSSGDKVEKSGEGARSISPDELDDDEEEADAAAIAAA